MAEQVTPAHDRSAGGKSAPTLWLAALTGTEPRVRHRWLRSPSRCCRTTLHGREHATAAPSRECDTKWAMLYRAGDRAQLCVQCESQEKKHATAWHAAALDKILTDGSRWAYASRRACEAAGRSRRLTGCPRKRTGAADVRSPSASRESGVSTRGAVDAGEGVPRVRRWWPGPISLLKPERLLP